MPRSCPRDEQHDLLVEELAVLGDHHRLEGFEPVRHLGVVLDAILRRDVATAISIEVGSGASFVSAEAVDGALRDAGLDSATTDNVVAGFEKAQLEALEAGLLLAALIALGALLLTRTLRSEKLRGNDSAQRASSP